MLKGQPIARRLSALHGKRLWLTFTDTGNCLRFVVRHGTLQPDRALNATPEIHIQGELKHFLLLATRNEDPDTLFFSRQLSLEGNTEDGLYVKNLLDALDFDTRAHLEALFGRVLATKITPLLEQAHIGQRLHNWGRQLLN